LTEAEILIDIRERLKVVETKLDILTNNPTCNSENHNAVESRVVEIETCNKSTVHRLKILEDNNTWLWRTMAGAVIVSLITAIVSIVFKKG